MLELGSHQRAYLRSLAHAYKPVVHVGDKGITDALVKQVDAALLAHELIKVRMEKPADKKRMAAELAERSGAALCGLLGHTVLLFKPHPEKPRIVLPER